MVSEPLSGAVSHFSLDLVSSPTGVLKIEHSFVN